MWGNFITQNNPSIPLSIANGANGTGDGSAVTDWPVWSLGGTGPQMVNLNETGGQPFQAGYLARFTVGSPNATEYKGPGSRKHISVVDAYTWRAEGGFGVIFGGVSERLCRGDGVESGRLRLNA